MQCARSTTAADVCQRVLRFIENNYSRQPLRLKDLAQELGYDSAYLGKLLKSEDVYKRQGVSIQSWPGKGTQVDLRLPARTGRES